MSAAPDDPIPVLHVDDEPAILDLTTQFLEREDKAFSVLTAASVEEAVDVIEVEPVECVVSDYLMADTDGLDLLERVREGYPDLPFILYTVLANRIANAAEQYRLEREYERTRRRFERLIEHSVEVIPILDGNGVIRYVTPSSRRVLGHEPEELVGENAFEYVHPEDVERAVEQFTKTIEDPESFPEVEYRFMGGDGSWVHLYGRAKNLLDDPDVEGIVSYNRAVDDLGTG